ncbi:unnamed protein product, partial [Rhizoctonia solani]
GRLAQDLLDDEDSPEDGVDDMAAEPQQLPKRVRLFFGTTYPVLLKDLFNYEAPDIKGQDLNIFKKSGLSNLQKQLEAYDLLTREMQKPVMTAGFDV